MNRGYIISLTAIGAILFSCKPSDKEQFEQMVQRAEELRDSAIARGDTGKVIVSAPNPIEYLDPYEVIETAFEGRPEKSKVQPMLERVMLDHDFPVTNSNILKAANALVELRKASLVGVTEMEILRASYQFGTKGISLGEQLGAAAAALEMSKKEQE